MMRNLVPIVAALAAAAIVPPSRADEAADGRICVDPKTTAQDRIGACSRLIDSTSEKVTAAVRVNAYSNRGVAHYALRQYERAIADYDKAIALQPGNARSYLNRGLANFALREYPRAIEDFDRAIAANPDYAAAYAARGQSNERLGRKDDAIRDYKAALARNPNFKPVREALERLGVAP